MNIAQIQPDPVDPKKKTQITGTISQILGQEQTDYGLKQTVVCDGVTATFWAGKQFSKPLTQADLNKPMEFMCGANLYQGMVQHNLSRVRSGDGGGRNFARESQIRSRSMALSYALEHNGDKWPQAATTAQAMYEFMENGTMPVMQALNNIDQPPDADPNF